MDKNLLIIGFLIVLGSLGGITKLLSDVAQSLKRIEELLAKQRGEGG